MLDRRIKYFEKYQDKLKYFAKAVGIKIEYTDIDGEGCYLPSRNIIRLDPDNSESREIAVTLHELGHSMDLDILRKKSSKILDEAYRAVYCRRPTDKQLSLILLAERRAWEHGKLIAKRLRIPLGTWYGKIRAQNLRSYREQ